MASAGWTIDISVAHLWNTDVLSQAADEDGIALAKREISKNKKYSSKAMRAVRNPSNWSLNILAIGVGKANQFLHE